MKEVEKKKSCAREPGDCIKGDLIYIECRSPGKWKMFRMTGTHQGHKCKAEKNAMAVVLKKYTNITP